MTGEPPRPRFGIFRSGDPSLAAQVDEDEGWKLTREKATPLHIGPCPECERLREQVQWLTTRNAEAATGYEELRGELADAHEALHALADKYDAMQAHPGSALVGYDIRQVARTLAARPGQEQTDA